MIQTVTMAPAKEFLCKKCGNIHKRPINSKCTFKEDNSDSSALPANDSDVSTLKDSNDLNLQILAELKSLGGRMSMMEEKMANREATDASIPVQQVIAATTAGTSTSTSTNGTVWDSKFKNWQIIRQANHGMSFLSKGIMLKSEGP